MRRQIKKPLFITVIIIAFILVILFISASVLFKEELTIMSSIKRESEDNPFYYMEVEGDYHFEEFLAQGGAVSDGEVSDFITKQISKGFYSVDVTNNGPSCSVISAEDVDGSHLWGRNYDRTTAVPIIVTCTPKDGYASVSTCDFVNITNDPDAAPENMIHKMLAIASLYVPMDGINEAGLCVADLEVNEGGMQDVDTDKPDLTVTTAIRLILNKCSTVKEALDLLALYDIHPSGGTSHHIAISDAEGTSVVLEFVDGKQIPVPSRYVTNFNLANKDITAGGESSQKRYEILRSVYDEHNGMMEESQIRETLKAVAQTKGDYPTQWSITYNQAAKLVTYHFRNNFSLSDSFIYKGFSF